MVTMWWWTQLMFDGLVINDYVADRDYCSSEYGVTRYSEQCLDNCERRAGKPFHWSVWCHHLSSRLLYNEDRDMIFINQSSPLFSCVSVIIILIITTVKENLPFPHLLINILITNIFLINILITKLMIIRCHTHPTRRGDWDYCSPYPRDQVCCHSHSKHQNLGLGKG